jgi:hypothetical protein
MRVHTSCPWSVEGKYTSKEAIKGKLMGKGSIKKGELP